SVRVSAAFAPWRLSYFISSGRLVNFRLILISALPVRFRGRSLRPFYFTRPAPIRKIEPF
ncbi:hypothetical protein, partial [Actinomadura harenae]|uniref:hypothetical protein n=1 Tax=Actinomadura harenae TaxID=2483351 RepID=UPI001F2ABC5D